MTSSGRGTSSHARGPVAAFHQHVKEDSGEWYCYACDMAVVEQDCPYNLMWRKRIGLPV